MSSASREHWLDLVAARSTRGQVLKSLLGGVALTLPFARSAPAAVRKGPHDCQKGCFVASHTRYDRLSSPCGGVYHLANAKAWLDAIAMPAAIAVYPLRVEFALLEADRCYDHALMAEKAMQSDCLKDDCPGFDPDGPESPCGDSCKLVGGKCCPDPESAIGYTCYEKCAD
jgi:hypothetical protein